MTGLIYKDLLCQMKTLKTFVVVLVVYGALAVGGLWDTNILTTLMFVIVIMLPINNFSFDSAAKWESFGLALPVSRRQVVGARYLFTVLLTAAAMVVVFAVGLAVSLTGWMESWGEFGMTTAAMTALALVMNGVMLPLLYRFGAERARVVYFGVLGCVALAGVLFYQFMGGKEWLASLSSVPGPSSEILLVLPFLLCAAGLIVLGISFLVSCGIYGRRDL